MRVYLAADFRRREEMCEAAAELRGIDPTLEVVSEWHDPGNDVAKYVVDTTMTEVDPRGEAGANATRESDRDLEAIAGCDVLIQFTTGGKERGGRHVELGAALALGKTVLVVGPREHVHHFSGGIRRVFHTWEGAKWWLEGVLDAPQFAPKVRPPALAPVELPADPPPAERATEPSITLETRDAGPLCADSCRLPLSGPPSPHCDEPELHAVPLARRADGF